MIAGIKRNMGSFFTFQLLESSWKGAMQVTPTRSHGSEPEADMVAVRSQFNSDNNGHEVDKVEVWTNFYSYSSLSAAQTARAVGYTGSLPTALVW